MTDDRAAGALADNIAYFVRALRAAGLPVGTGHLLDALAAVQQVGIGSRTDFYWTLHAVLVSRIRDREVFDQAFHVFWRNPGLLERMRSLALPDSNAPVVAPEPLARRVADALATTAPGTARISEETELDRDASETWSAAESLESQDFESMSAAEVEQAKAAISRMHLLLKPVRVRRRELHPRGQRTDLRASMRRMLRHGPDSIALVKARNRSRPPPLVVICDISGSMKRYSRMLLHFTHTLTNDRDRVFTFVFGTRLTHITRFLRERDVDVALARVGSEVLDWDGGTRIGGCIKTFNQDWSRRVLGTGAVVLLITDGLDRDAGSGLGDEMRRLHMSCARLICLNPLLRYEAYEPRTQGMRAILPHVDEFLSIHNLDSMRSLVEALGRDRARDAKRVDEWLPMAR